MRYFLGGVMATVKFQATRKNIDLSPTGNSANWGVIVQCEAVIWFATTSLNRRLIVYFLREGSPDPGPQYNAGAQTGAVFLPASEYGKWADLVYSGKAVYVRLETAGGHNHSVSTYNG